MPDLTFGSSIGQLIGGEPKVRRVYYSDEIKNALGQYTQLLQDWKDRDVISLADYESAIKRIQPEAEALAREDQQRYGQLLDANLAYDPLANYERLRSGNLSALDTWGAKLSGYGSAADKAAMAARGYGGRGGGTYEQILRTDRISKNIAPVLNTIFSNLGREAAGAETGRLSNILSSQGLMQERAQVPYRSVDRLLDPVRARGQTAAGIFSNFGALGGIARNNIAGFRQEKSPWQIAGEAGDSVVNAALELYSGYLGGGLGGMGGGMGGGAGGGGGNVNWQQMMNRNQGGYGGGATPNNAAYNFYYPGVNAGY